ncbi:hypothetical protein PPUJ20028_21930 [Pseudomonas putida]|uniref:Uncharacterized protein n=1 Tax=Pseudomonas putida TaxID=303 RepID=A0AA37RFW1_PSEPU|nr:hypothetical protein [Pseudomonas putida]GLO13612.1 hypothetical protein PPUJ20028_21930 [Pseudomonas putida]GLO33389.1 hypothetical protein PPUN14671_02220 [Pseudomonas putida]HDS0967427.1 hypothetical protein [Pseudomonas putida]HDS0992237.1 hypothetical protein [Pseudomonas putida]
MSVFTAYFCGTGSHRFDDANPNFWNGELVATLASNDQGREFAHWIAVDGPGSGNLQDDKLFVEPGGYFNWTGQLFGRGWEENVNHVLQVIKGESSWQRTELSEEEYERLKDAGVPIPEASSTASWFWRTYDYGERHPTPQELQERIISMFRKPCIPTQVNLVGWSRGGISCHMLANAMAQDPVLRDIPVNIFAIDPVPGIGNVQAERITLAGNVREYVGFYSRDERSKGFACVIPSVASGTQICIYPMPGRHATLVGNASVDGASDGKVLKEPGLIVRHFAEVCLTRWGVELDKQLALSDRQLMLYHQAMAAAEGQYHAMRSQSYTVLTEGENDNRLVHCGEARTHFSKVCGDDYEPTEGLALTRWDTTTYKALR